MWREEQEPEKECRCHRFETCIISPFTDEVGWIETWAYYPDSAAKKAAIRYDEDEDDDAHPLLEDTVQIHVKNEKGDIFMYSCYAENSIEYFVNFQEEKRNV